MQHSVLVELAQPQVTGTESASDLGLSYVCVGLHRTVSRENRTNGAQTGWARRGLVLDGPMSAARRSAELGPSFPPCWRPASSGISWDGPSCQLRSAAGRAPGVIDRLGTEGWCPGWWRWDQPQGLCTAPGRSQAPTTAAGAVRRSWAVLEPVPGPVAALRWLSSAAAPCVATATSPARRRRRPRPRRLGPGRARHHARALQTDRAGAGRCASRHRSQAGPARTTHS